MPIAGTTLTSLRPLIQGTNGVVVSSHPSAAMIGLNILRQGGNAIDAGVAVGLTLNVVHAHECHFLGVAPTIMYLNRSTEDWHSEVPVRYIGRLCRKFSFTRFLVAITY
jgi:gamma-glutamyltranspeptidase / glutathione hydrolase